MNITLLIDPMAVRQSGLSDTVIQRPINQRSISGARANVLRVYPVGHAKNPSGQVRVDVQPDGGLPVLLNVPVAMPHAHAETELAAPFTSQRQPYAPKTHNRMQGVSRDLRPGTFVWVQFIDGSIHEPVITGTMPFDQGDAKDSEATQALIERVDGKGEPVPGTAQPLNSDMAEYPWAVDAYNGGYALIDNRGSRYVRTSCDRTPVFPGHNDIPASPEPEGNYVVSTRGAVVGNAGTITGRHPTRAGDTSTGRQFRRCVNAEDGTIRDDNTGSKIGNIVKKAAGKFFAWATGGEVHIRTNRGSLTISPAGDVSITAEGTTLLDGQVVKLAGQGSSDEIVLWPQLMQMMQALVTIFDTHVHSGVSTGDGSTASPTTPQGVVFGAQKDASKATGVFAAQTNSGYVSLHDDPDKA